MGKLNDSLKKLGKGLTGNDIKANKFGDIVEEMAENCNVAAGKANLVNGKVPASELPSYVDDAVEGYLYDGAFYEDAAHEELIEGELGKIYIDLPTGYTYRWGGSVYVQIGGQDLSGYQPLIDSNHKLDADLVDDANSTHKFTNADDISKLGNIEAGAQVNVLEGVQQNGVDLEVSGKKVNVVADANVIEGVQVNGTDLTVTNKKVNIDLSGKQDALTAGANITIDENNVISAAGGGSNEKILLSAKVYPLFKRFNKKVWSGFNTVSGGSIWTDGENIYFSTSYGYPEQYYHYVLDKATSTWSAKTWTGFTNFNSNHIWTDGENIYCSKGSNQYVLDKATSTWSAKTWTGLTNFTGENIWTDGDNIYYSTFSDQYVLDKATSTWSAKTWTGLTYFMGAGIWTDGDNIYYSYGANQYVLDKATSTWSAKTWTGLTNFAKENIWTDGENIYYSNGSNQYVLDKATSTWSAKTWTGLTSFYGNYLWTDGDNIYYGDGSQQYVFDKVSFNRI